MKPDIRWQLLLAVVCIGLVVSVIGLEYQTTGQCTEVVPGAGGRLQIGIVGIPTYINPLLSDQNPVDTYLVNLIFDGLTRRGEDGHLSPALAESWTVSDDGRRYTFSLDENATWHDGQKVTSEDVLFTYSLLQEDEFPASSALKSTMASVAIEILDDSRILFELPEPYGPFLEATTTGLLPAHLLIDIEPSEIETNVFNQLPIGTGPFLVNSRREWQETGEITLAPNPHYWRQGASLDGIDFQFYPNSEELAQGYSDSDIQAASSIHGGDLTQLATQGDIRLFSSWAPLMTQLLFNLNGGESGPTRSLEFRRALAYGLDRNLMIGDVLGGLAVPLEGPYLPTNWAYNMGALTEYQADASLAMNLLEEDGWNWGEGEEYRSSAGTELAVRLLYPDDAQFEELARTIASQWDLIGIKTILIPAAAEEYDQHLSANEFDAALVEINPTGDPDLYDFWSQEAIVRGQNFGGWNNRRASEALESARQLTSPTDRMPYYNVFLNLYNDNLPALTLFQHVNSFGISSAIEDVEIGQFESPREIFENFADWFTFYREVAVVCPGEDAKREESQSGQT